MKLIDKSAVVAEIERLKDEYLKHSRNKSHAKWSCGTLDNILSFLDALEMKEEPVSEELKDAAIVHCVDVMKGHPRVMDETDRYICNAFMAGAQWQKEHLWKPANGEDLPEYDREVIVLTQPYPLEGSEFAASFAHRPDPKGWDGKSVATGKVEHYTPKTYGKGGWNIPDVIMWLDLDIPKLEED